MPAGCLRMPALQKHRHWRCLRDACGCLRYENTSICGACGMPADACATKTQALAVPAGCLRVPAVQKRKHARCPRDAWGCLRYANTRICGGCGMPAGACGTKTQAFAVPAGCLGVPAVRKAQAPAVPASACGCLRYENTGIGGACGMPGGACGTKSAGIGGACGMPGGACGTKTQAPAVPAGGLRVPVVQNTAIYGARGGMGLVRGNTLWADQPIK